MIRQKENIRKFFCAALIAFLFLFSNAQQLVLRGDYPDPSVIKIGDTYWASATTSNWMPAFPILKSKDLIHWQTVSHVFPKLPDWADYYFWAPELSYENGKVYVYYAAHKKDGNLCVAVASADRPEGPYTDHGPLVCQEDGSIDAFPMRDENGKLYLIWKEDANSIGKPTPIWAQQLNEERTKLIGEKKELFRNTASWEKNLVEGVSMIHHGDYFYAFYAAAGCCGAACSYGVGIARSRNLLGPWEKYSGNPVLTSSGNWNCPGHGTPVDRDGRHYFMYHAYDKNTTVYTGREALIIEYRFTSDNWIEFIKNDSPAGPSIKNFTDKFKGKMLSNQWQWSVFQKPHFKVQKGELCLNASSHSEENFLAQKTTTGNYTAIAKVNAAKSTGIPGLAVIGDENNLVVALYQDNAIRVIQLKDGRETEIAKKLFTADRKFYLKVRVKNSNQLMFFVSNTKNNFDLINPAAIDGSYLPPWDRAVRIGVISKGDKGKISTFDTFEIWNTE